MLKVAFCIYMCSLLSNTLFIKYKIVQNCRFYKELFFQKQNSEWKPINHIVRSENKCQKIEQVPIPLQVDNTP